MEHYKVSFNNGTSYKNISELTEEEIKQVLESIDNSYRNDAVEEAANAVGAVDTDREWLDRFLAALGEDWVIG